MISIIMGIYNCEKTLEESIDSLLNQTYKNFELIICDDGSSDNTYVIARRYADHYNNIVLLRNDKNRGLNFTLNYCLKFAKGEYIARHDGDDISLPTRFEKQVEVLDSNHEISIVSSNIISFNDKGDFKLSRAKCNPTKIDFIYGTPFCHPACIFRKVVLAEVGGYSESKLLLRVEDYHLFFKIYSKGYMGYNIQEPLYKWRDDYSAYKRRNLKNRINEFYVRFIGFRMLKLPFYSYFFCFRPLIVWLLPGFVYKYFHNKNIF